LLEDAYGMARGRQLGSDGMVPPEWATLAKGDGAKATTTEAVSVTQTSWDKPSSPITEDNSAKAAPQHTIAFPKQNSITSALTALSRQDRLAEEARLKLRNARKIKKESQAVNASAAPGTPTEGSGPIDGAAPSGPIGEKAPEMKMSKKQREALEKSARADMSEEIQTRSANATATMQLGGGKQYAWMNKGAAATPAGRQVPGFRGTPKVVTAAKQAPGPTDEFGGVRDRRFGQWREDGVGGRGVQLRDWIGVLEMDGREKRTLGWAYARQGTENTDGVVSTVLTAEAANSNMQGDPTGVAQPFSPQVTNGYIAGPQQAGANFSPRPTQGAVNGHGAQSGPTSQVSSPYVQNAPNPLQSQQHVQPQVQTQQQSNAQLPQQSTALGAVANAQTVSQPMSRTSSQGRSSSQGKPLQQQQQQQQQEQRIGGVSQPQQPQPHPSQAPAPAAPAPAQNGVAVS